MVRKQAAMAPDPEPGHATATRRLSRGPVGTGTSSLLTDPGHRFATVLLAGLLTAALPAPHPRPD